MAKSKKGTVSEFESLAKIDGLLDEPQPPNEEETLKKLYFFLKRRGLYQFFNDVIMKLVELEISLEILEREIGRINESRRRKKI
jgi:hypothetical protein